MSAALEGIRVILLDIEGTTTPVAFVHERLFTHARAHLDRYLEDHSDTPAVRTIAGQLATEHEHDRTNGATGLPTWRNDTSRAERESMAAYARWLMDRDRKSPGLKALQGLIWQAGYEARDLRGEVYDDVPRAMTRWRDKGLTIAIYSSGSELAQRLLFGSTPFGDLTPFIAAFFDTAVGAKASADSYRRIATALGCPTNAVLFISDVESELAAALEAGCAVRLCLRPGHPTASPGHTYEHVRSFDDLSHMKE